VRAPGCRWRCPAARALRRRCMLSSSSGAVSFHTHTLWCVIWGVTLFQKLAAIECRTLRMRCEMAWACTSGARAAARGAEAAPAQAQPARPSHLSPLSALASGRGRKGKGEMDMVRLNEISRTAGADSKSLPCPPPARLPDVQHDIPHGRIRRTAVAVVRSPSALSSRSVAMVATLPSSDSRLPFAGAHIQPRSDRAHGPTASSTARAARRKHTMCKPLARMAKTSTTSSTSSARRRA